MICEMCGKFGKRSKEHYFPKWMRKLVPLEEEGSTDRVTGKHSRRDVGTRTVPVCKACNEGWMEGLQRVARPHLEPLIKGERPYLTPGAAEALAQWSVMTGMALDGEHPHSRGIPAAERNMFAASQVVPENWQVFVGRSEFVSSRGFSHSSVMNVPPGWGEDGCANFNDLTEGQSSAILFGRLLVVVYSQYRDRRAFPEALKALNMYQIYPKFDHCINFEDQCLNPVLDYRSLHQTMLHGLVYAIPYDEMFPE